MRLFKKAFTMMELIIVIVVMGLLSKFGVEFMAQAYKGFIYSKINNSLQNESTTAVEFIAKRLSYRIKDSVIARQSDAGGTFTSVQNADNTAVYTTLEWVGSDVDNFRGDQLPNFSGIIDLKAATASATNLHSPATDTNAINTLIGKLSQGNSGINDAALYFVGSNSDVNTSYGWRWAGGALIDQQIAAMHPVQSVVGVATDFASSVVVAGVPVTFAGVDVYEYYKLAWTAYAIELEPVDGNLTFYYDYQPWNGERFDNDAKSQLIMQNVTTFKFKAIGSLLKIQVCVGSDLVGEEYSICKEKTIY